MKQRTEIIRLLVDAGADQSVLNLRGLTFKQILKNMLITQGIHTEPGSSFTIFFKFN